MAQNFVWLAGTAPFHRRLAERFEGRFPDIRCQAQYLNGTESVARFRRDAADVLASGLDEAVPALRNEGRLADLRQHPSWRNAPENDRDARGFYILFAAARSVLVYDPRKVDSPPRGYAELTEARWRSETALVDPRTCGFGVVFLRYAAANKSLGEDWIRRLGANKARFFRQTSDVVAAVAQGQSSFGLARDVECRAARSAGAKIEWISPAEGALLQRFPACLSAQAPNAEPAHVFLDWLTHPETRAFLDAEGCGTTPGKKDWTSDFEAPARADTSAFAERASQWIEKP